MGIGSTAVVSYVLSWCSVYCCCIRDHGGIHDLLLITKIIKDTAAAAVLSSRCFVFYLSLLGVLLVLLVCDMVNQYRHLPVDMLLLQCFCVCDAGGGVFFCSYRHGGGHGALLLLSLYRPRGAGTREPSPQNAPCHSVDAPGTPFSPRKVIATPGGAAFTRNVPHGRCEGGSAKLYI